MREDSLVVHLDEALARWMEQDPLDQILDDYPGEAAALQPLLEAAGTMSLLQPVSLPSTAQMDIDREVFLAQAANLAVSAVSPSPLTRLNWWVADQWSLLLVKIQPKERRKMAMVFLKVSLILSMILGLIGGPVYVSADVLPGSPLYPLKISLENVRLAFSKGAAEKANLHMAFAETRVEEMARLAGSGKTIPAATRTNLQDQWQEALRWIAQSGDGQMTALLAQAQIMAQQQNGRLGKMPAAASGQKLASFMADVQAFLAAGNDNPQAFRLQKGNLKGWDEAGGPFGPGNGGQFGPQPGAQGFQPGPGYGPGPGDGTGTGSGYGPGGGNGDCDGSGDCDGDGNSYGPGGGNGPGDGTGTGGGYGPGGGNGDCDGSGDCDGDGNSYGPGGGNGPGDGTGTGEGNGPGGGNGDCDGSGNCDGSGSGGTNGGNGPGDGTGNGTGNGEGNGPGGGNGDCDGSGTCDGSGGTNGGNGNGGDTGSGSGNGDGDCDGSGTCDGNGNGGDTGGTNGGNGNGGDTGGGTGDDGGSGGDNGGGSGGGGTGGDNGGGSDGGGTGGDNGGGNGG